MMVRLVYSPWKEVETSDVCSPRGNKAFVDVVVVDVAAVVVVVVADAVVVAVIVAGPVVTVDDLVALVGVIAVDHIVYYCNIR
jgi:hypothetical protein